MKHLNASDAKREFGDMLIKVQSEPVIIKKNGKPVAVVVSAKEYALLETLKEERLMQAIQEGLDDASSKKMLKGKDVLNRLRKRVS